MTTILLSRLDMADLVGGSAASCLGAVFGISLGLLFGAAATGGAALAIAGAYAPLAAAFCG
jgi:hypothetical protein